MSPPSTPRHRYLSRDERLKVQTLSNAGHSQAWIQRHLGFTKRQVATAIYSDQVTPTRRSGRPPKLSNN
ncbi:hypothetical protein C7974DRAFT_192700 [Boeremia exigua]|uniref:uncharacterized protein n=1 Tax=Boeremia exigua TaxID=749465 RepID=UPI001E8CB8A5|nr:uncharacterized protein C7974DRAFT_192700 [Boeremia exigua]KAH6629744.1 hypothetical protein C7974DRAFT_192700 [Boeremia exigua]